MNDGLFRCFGNRAGQEAYATYHDQEWGVPVYDDQKLFEMLTLEGAQAGLSWETVLRKREGYRALFHHFDIHKICQMTDDELDRICDDKRVIRHRLKIYSVRKNAIIFRHIQKEFDSFSHYLWSYVNHRPLYNHWQNFEEVPVTTSISDALSKDLKKRGMSFVGSTIIYAYMQAAGLVNDHLVTCHCYAKRDASHRR